MVIVDNDGHVRLFLRQPFADGRVAVEKRLPVRILLDPLGDRAVIGLAERDAQSDQRRQGDNRHVHREAEIYGEEARKKMAEQIERRTKLAEQKIALAEAAAVKDVRIAATELAIEAASKIIGTEVKGAKAAGLVDTTIADLKKQLN